LTNRLGSSSVNEAAADIAKRQSTLATLTTWNSKTSRPRMRSRASIAERKRNSGLTARRSTGCLALG
jgi:hypothetical protein